MKSFRLHLLLPATGLLVLLCIANSSCKTGRAARKTLPDDFRGQQIEEKFWQKQDASGFTGNISSDLPFYAVDTTIDQENFVAVYLRNPGFDSLAFNMIKSYEPFAGSLLKMINGQGVKGVLIDFRQNTDTDPGQASFSVANHSSNQSLENSEYSPIRIVFLWDENSSARAEKFIDELRESPVVSTTEINSQDPKSPVYKQDCFNPVSPGFND